ncbi:hypothetical protein ACWGTO_16470 [Mesorhizobium sp. PL10]
MSARSAGAICRCEVTDLLSCLFLNGQWLIVQKVFNAEPLR